MRRVSAKERVIKVTWRGNLQISKGDEIEIPRGKGGGDNIQASILKNLTNGRTEISDIEHILDITMPKDFNPPIHGIVRAIYAGGSSTVFTLVEDFGLLEVGLEKLINEATVFLDKEIVEKCVHKRETEDIVTSAFRILEERIREKIGASYERCGVDLINDAFNLKTGKLVFGKSMAEQEGLFHLFRGAVLFFRNPSSHRFIEDYNEFEVFEIVIQVNLLLNILNKATLRTP